MKKLNSMRRQNETKQFKSYKSKINKIVLLKKYNKHEVVLSNPSNVYSELDFIKDADKEHFVVFHLNTKLEIILREVVGIGILDSSIIHIREIFRSAIMNNANSIIVAHNHPSGSTKPSMEDIELTKTIKEAGELLGIHLHDHVIAGDTDYWSWSNDK